MNIKMFYVDVAMFNTKGEEAEYSGYERQTVLYKDFYQDGQLSGIINDEDITFPTSTDGKAESIHLAKFYFPGSEFAIGTAVLSVTMVVMTGITVAFKKEQLPLYLG